MARSGAGDVATAPGNSTGAMDGSTGGDAAGSVAWGVSDDEGLGTTATGEAGGDEPMTPGAMLAGGTVDEPAD